MKKPIKIKNVEFYKIIGKENIENENIFFSYSFINNLKTLKNKKKNISKKTKKRKQNGKYCVLHVYNPNHEKILINEQNNKFMNLLSDMIHNFEDSKKGCFNHENEYRYDNQNINESKNQIINNFFNCEYSFILIDYKNRTPISTLCLDNNIIYSVCTNYDYRKLGLNSKLFNHFFSLIKKNKLKKEIDNNIKLYLLKKNPNYNFIKKYYEDFFDFREVDNNDNKIIMEKNL